MIKTAVVGVGSFGQQHARVLSALSDSELVAVVDANAERGAEIAELFDCEALTDITALAGKVDAASVAVPTALHRDIGVSLLENGIDVLVEKPIAPDLASADRLVEAAASNGRILQVGHLERFNPAVEAARDAATLPLFFEVHRMSQFSPRSLDVDVVLDLMIHDLDIVLNMVNSRLSRLEAAGIAVLSVSLDVDVVLDLMIHDLDIVLNMVNSRLSRLEAAGIAVLSVKPDIASVRLVFENGCVANLSASRVSVEKIRKLRFFQPRQYVSVDYTRQDGMVYEVSESRQIGCHPLKTEKGEPLVRQIESFLDCVQNRTPPRVSGADGREVLALALTIVEEMERHSGIVAETLRSQDK